MTLPVAMLSSTRPASSRARATDGSVGPRQVRPGQPVCERPARGAREAREGDQTAEEHCDEGQRHPGSATGGLGLGRGHHPAGERHSGEDERGDVSGAVHISDDREDDERDDTGERGQAQRHTATSGADEVGHAEREEGQRHPGHGSSPSIRIVSMATPIPSLRTRCDTADGVMPSRAAMSFWVSPQGALRGSSTRPVTTTRGYGRVPSTQR